MNSKIVITALGGLLAASTALAEPGDTLRNKAGSEYLFTEVVNHEALPVQNQSISGTCWSFSMLSYFESEIMRMGKGEHNLSEMFIVRHAYVDKAINYVRMHGNFNFGGGGAFHDIPHVIRHHGIVPEEVYEGLNYGTEKHDHRELDAVLTGMVEAVVKNPNKQLSTAWADAIGAATDSYLGEIPEKFEYNGNLYTPKEYANELGLDMDDYISLSSFSHHPFYEEFVLEVPDNWGFGMVYNLPINELMMVMEEAVKSGYTFAWASDVSEKGFSFRDGLAILPEDESTIKSKGTDSRYFNDAGAQKVSNAFMVPVEEKQVTQEMRQEAFDNYETTDDHGMHVTGLYTDQEGKKYFMVKNSWGTDHNDCDGYFLASFPFVKYKTMDIMIHKDALPKSIAKKLGLR